MDDVVARQGGSFAVAFDKRAEADENGKNVCAAGRMGEESACGFKDKVDFFFERARLEAGRIDGGVGGSRNGVAVPGNDKEDAAVAGLGNHEGGVAAEEAAIEDEMDALAQDHERVGGGVGQAADFVGEDAGGVDDNAGLNGEVLAGEGIAGGEACLLYTSRCV